VSEVLTIVRNRLFVEIKQLQKQQQQRRRRRG